MKDRSWLRPPRNSVTTGLVPSWWTGRGGTWPQRLHSADSGTAPALHQPGGARDPRVPFTGVRRHTCMWGESLAQDEDPCVCDPDVQAVCGASRGCNYVGDRVWNNLYLCPLRPRFKPSLHVMCVLFQQRCIQQAFGAGSTCPCSWATSA